MEAYKLHLNNKLTDEKLKLFLSFISMEKRREIEKMLNWQSAHRSLMGELLVRKLIQDKLKIANKDIYFAKGKYGKPYLKGHPNFHFNISHSGDWIVCAIDDQPIGIDVEKIRPVNLDIARHYFSAEEYEMIKNKEENDQQRTFFKIFTLKESYIKALGTGLATSLVSFAFQFDDHDNIVLKIFGDDLDNDFFFKQYNMGDHYELCICSRKDIFPEMVSLLEVDCL